MQKQEKKIWMKMKKTEPSEKRKEKTKKRFTVKVRRCWRVNKKDSFDITRVRLVWWLSTAFSTMHAWVIGRWLPRAWKGNRCTPRGISAALPDTA